MERTILKDHIKDAIKNRTVVAVIFHTFNFDPVFFENYVMPLFVPGKDFGNEAIYNKILWRYCAREELIPPIAVFCDYYAKDNTQAPSLGYDIHCLRVPSIGNSICNFHPKNIFILVKDENSKKESLLFYSGSNNLTPNGWCDNFECFSFMEIEKNRSHPVRTSINSIQTYLDKVGGLIGSKNKLIAKEKIDTFLNYVDSKKEFNEDNYFYNSFSNSFFKFLKDNVFSKDDISEVEIISPYFSKNTELIKQLQSKNVKRIKALIPSLRTDEILLDKDTFISFQNSGIKWCYWLAASVNREVRNQHSKIYRFYGSKHCYTFIGSVNFTDPGFAGYSTKNNKGNIESGVLYKEPPNKLKLLKSVGNLDMESLRFIDLNDLEGLETTSGFDRNAPDIEFEIDWKTKVLTIQAKIDQLICSFYKFLDEVRIINGKSKHDLSNVEIRQLAKNSILKVVLLHKGVESVYSYYPVQKNMETKPLGFKWDANLILKYWQFFNDGFERESITKRVAESITDESGIIDEKRIETKLLLNEMAAHFTGLSNLEKYLFSRTINKKAERQEKFKDLKYYLLSENIETLIFYLNDLKEKFEKKTIQNSFYWMVLQILNKVIYAKAENWEFRKDMDPAVWKGFRFSIREKREYLTNESNKIENKIPGLKNKADWILKQLVSEND